MLSEFDAELHLKYLQLALTRIDILIRREVRRWQLAGQAPADTFRGLYVSEGEVAALLNRPLAGNWGELAALDADEVQAFAKAEADVAQAGQIFLEQMKQQGQVSRLRQVAQTFGLNAFEVDTLLICLAPTLDLRYERFYGYLQDDVSHQAVFEVAREKVLSLPLTFTALGYMPVRKLAGLGVQMGALQ